MSAMVWRACARQRQVALALDDHRVALAALVVELHVAHLCSSISELASSSRRTAWPVRAALLFEQQVALAVRNLTSKSLV